MERYRPPPTELPGNGARGVLIETANPQPEVRRNAEIAKDWEFREPAQFLYRWAVLFKDELIDGVALLDRGRLPEPVISFDNMRHSSVLAGYRLKRNPQGLLDEIVFNTTHFEDTPEGKKWRFGEWELLETLAHELLHLKQQNFGQHPVSRNYHNSEFCDMAESIGLHPLPIYGCHYAPADGAFARLLTKHGIERPVKVEVPKGDKINWWELIPGKERKEGRSSLYKWGCSRCGFAVNATTKKDIKIICGECKEETGEDIYFVRVERKRRNSNQSKPVEEKANQELQVELPVWEGKEENEETNSEEAAVKTRPDPGHHLG
jgi:hypothetical protein